ncbi:hypothetical protein MAA_00485 [Metarhizium robertsii ARSEF 23]|uniref:Uncharacterized protein n=1 Tax=Metarhizium robertsii (strain ARSEF 23 / ATCC MYA-3075) TaxID=655844 RepID=E9EK71_METRA|nr:uncharacterized protein MAA_00485 [Metarhizium robertsii ARSEF 23]EFZ03411.1 hypothetical protein MAA_00485 [Metarhizium robertsii ARSEF 23]
MDLALQHSRFTKTRCASNHVHMLCVFRRQLENANHGIHVKTREHGQGLPALDVETSIKSGSIIEPGDKIHNMGRSKTARGDTQGHRGQTSEESDQPPRTSSQNGRQVRKRREATRQTQDSIDSEPNAILIYTDGGSVNSREGTAAVCTANQTQRAYV